MRRREFLGMFGTAAAAVTVGATSFFDIGAAWKRAATSGLWVHEWERGGLLVPSRYFADLSSGAPSIEQIIEAEISESWAAECDRALVDYLAGNNLRLTA